MHTKNNSSLQLKEEYIKQYSIVVVIPAYNVENEIAEVLESLPTFLKFIIVVDDCSKDNTFNIAKQISSNDKRIILHQHKVNQGVGGAMITGFRLALKLGCQIVVKFDGDGQMSPEYLPKLILPLIKGDVDYTKGNRFHDFSSLQQMPTIRRLGNTALSFLTKAATGYWNCFDPNNGFIAIRSEVLSQIKLEDVHKSFFFETSMLSNIYLLGAKIQDIPMPAKYGNESSNLSISKVLGEFPFKLLRCFCRRLILKNFLYDFNMESVYLLTGLPLTLTGVVFGLYNWVLYALKGITAPTGTIMIPTLLVILGFQLLLAAISIDLQAIPQKPISDGPLEKIKEPYKD